MTQRTINVEKLNLVGARNIRATGLRSYGSSGDPAISIESPLNVDVHSLYKGPQHIERLGYSWTASNGLAATSTTAVLDGVDLQVGETPFAFRLDDDYGYVHPRALVMETNCAAADGTFDGMVVTLAGYDMQGNATTCEVPLNASTPISVPRIFSLLTSITVPANAIVGTLDVGYTDYLPLSRPCTEVLEINKKLTADTEYKAVDSNPSLENLYYLRSFNRSYRAHDTVFAHTALDIVDNTATDILAGTASYLGSTSPGFYCWEMEILSGSGDYEIVSCYRVGDNSAMYVRRGMYGTRAVNIEPGMLLLERPRNLMRPLIGIVANTRFEVVYRTPQVL